MKRIVYTQRVELIEAYKERRDCADQRIAAFIYDCGYVGIPVPNYQPMLECFLYEVNPDGVLLTGGNSMTKYGGYAPERDRTDRALIDYALAKKIPLYGFCRGMQSILDYFHVELREVRNHTAVRHRLSGRYEGMEVNSYHNQAAVGNAGDFEILAQTDDGVIEAIRSKKYPILGTMWHPEREEVFNDLDRMRVKELFK